MTFTNELPTVPGFYAWREGVDDVAPDVAVVFKQFGVLKLQLSGRGRGATMRVLEMRGQWCRLVPAEEIEKAWDEHAVIERDADGYADEFNAWQNSRAKRVMEGKE